MSAQEKLTGRQYALRRLLLDRSGEWLTAKQIYELMAQSLIPSYRYEWDGKKNFTGSVGRKIVEDVAAINASGIFDKIVVSDRARGYKLATKEEYRRFSRSRWISLKRSMKALAGMDRQAGMDSQGILDLGDLSDVRRFRESFVGEAKR